MLLQGPVPIPVLFSLRARNSSFIASCQYAIFEVCEYEVGIGALSNEVKRAGNPYRLGATEGRLECRRGMILLEEALIPECAVGSTGR